MNITEYIFGNFGGGYTQFPDDYTQGVFLHFKEMATTSSQIATHREGDLIYYGYIRKLDANSQYIGFCVILNGVMFSEIEKLFPVFETVVELLVSRGEILGFSDKGNLYPCINSLNDKQGEVKWISSFFRNALSDLKDGYKKLPPISYGVAKTESKIFSIEEDENDIIVAATAKYSYTCILKKKGFDTASMTSYRGVIQKLNKDKETLRKEKKALSEENSELSKELTKAKAMQRNVTWVAVLGIAVIILGIVLWNKVLFPSEVTNYKTDEFVYYGPVNSDKKPNGVGVAIYPENDAQGRKYYVGKFVNGVRQDDDKALLLYKQGDYFLGSMEEDKLKKGVFFVNSDNSYFSGTFRDNKPYTGDWYDFKFAYSITKGK